MASPGRRIEDLLLEAGLASPQEVERARLRMRERGGRFLSNLVAGGVDDARLAAGLGAALGLPVADPAALTRVAAPRTPSRRAALRALAIERVLLPVGARAEPREVDVAMFDPTDREAIERLRAICGGAEVRVHVAPRRALLDAIATTYGREQSGTLGSAAEPAWVVIADDAAPLERSLGVEPVVTRVAELDRTPVPRLVELESEETERTPAPRLRPERLGKALGEIVAVLADLLEDRVSPRPRLGQELARLSRLIGRELGLSPNMLSEISVTASLHAVERALAADSEAQGGPPVTLDAALARVADDADGVAAMLRSLRHPAPAGDDAPLGARVIACARDYHSLCAATPDGRPDPATVIQLLRVTTLPEIIDALGRVMSAERHKELADAV